MFTETGEGERLFTDINFNVSGVVDCIVCIVFVMGCVIVAVFTLFKMRGELDFFNTDTPLLFMGEVSTAFLISFICNRRKNNSFEYKIH